LPIREFRRRRSRSATTRQWQGRSLVAASLRQPARASRLLISEAPRVPQARRDCPSPVCAGISRSAVASPVAPGQGRLGGGLNEAAAREASAQHRIRSHAGRWITYSQKSRTRVLSECWSNEPFGPPGRGVRYSGRCGCRDEWEHYRVLENRDARAMPVVRPMRCCGSGATRRPGRSWPRSRAAGSRTRVLDCRVRPPRQARARIPRLRGRDRCGSDS
jgi:hypothetical protein